MDSNLQVGPSKNADGSKPITRGTKTGAVCTTHANAGMSEPAQRATTFIVSNAVAGVAPGTVLSTTPPLALWNPPSSGKNVCIFKIVLGYVSGTLGAGSLVAGVVPNQATVPTTGAELTPQCTNIGFPRGVARAFVGSTLSAVPTILRPVVVLPAFAGGAAVPAQVQELTDGDIVIPPGSVFALQGVATAGTTPLVILAIEYEEVDI